MVTKLKIAKGVSWGILALYLSFGSGESAFGAPSRRLADQTWQKILSTNLVLIYYSLGQIGDLYRGKVYTPEKTSRYISFLKKIIKREKSFLESAKPGRGKSHRRWLESVKSMVDLIDLACQSLEGAIAKRPGKTVQQFITYRNSAAQDLRKLLAESRKKFPSYYRNGRSWSLRAIGRHLKDTLPLAFLAIGVTADGYFQLAFNSTYALGSLSAYKTLLSEQEKLLKKLKFRFKGMDRIYLARILPHYSSAIQLIEALEKFIKSRNRTNLISYMRKRINLFRALNSL